MDAGLRIDSKAKIETNNLSFNNCCRLINCVAVDDREQTVFPVCTAYRDPQAVMDETDMTEPKEIGVVQGGLDPRDQLVVKERKEIWEILASRAPPGKKESKERKVKVELQEHLSFPRT